jgi:ribosomal protein S12 methylthiotransferase
LKTKSNPHRIGIVSLGCAKNLVDSEVLLKQLDTSHFRIVPDPSAQNSLDTAIINTCGFILDAKQESIDTILQFVEAKKKGLLKNLFVMGCLSQRYKDQLLKEIPEVDDYFGVNDLPKIVGRVGGEYRSDLLGERYLTTPSHYAYLKIAEGCSRSCSFCSIPSIRGNHISKPLEAVLSEAKFLVSEGVNEINVVSQDTTYYGLDLYKKRKLPELMSALAAIPGIDWLRLHYTYPDGFPLELLDVMKNHRNICNYLDIPLQHISSRILRSMRRGITSSETRKLLETIRTRNPGIAIRTTFIAGYPGETEKEFRELKDFVQQSRFERMGVFTYSHEEDTISYKLKDDVPPEVKQERADELMDIQEEISLEINSGKIKNVIKVMIDRVEGEFFVGRTEIDSPEVDNEVLIHQSGKQATIGKMYNVRIISADPFDLMGEFTE